MRLYLARHGKAEGGPELADRHLSERGRADVDAVGRHLAAQGIAPQRMFHSTLSRARETAEILASHLAPDTPLQELADIEPWGDVRAFARLAAGWAEEDLPPTWVVGHEPFMGEAVSLLMGGDAHAGLVEVKTGSVMALDSDPFSPRWRLRWMLTPRVVRGPKTMRDEP